MRPRPSAAALLAEGSGNGGRFSVVLDSSTRGVLDGQGTTLDTGLGPLLWPTNANSASANANKGPAWFQTARRARRRQAVPLNPPQSFKRGPTCGQLNHICSQCCDGMGNHLEERLLDQAQARASYTPLFWGHSRSIPQGMILDDQPLVKSLFCPIRASPNGFFDFEASTP